MEPKLFILTFDTDDDDWYVIAKDEDEAKNKLVARIKDILDKENMSDFTNDQTGEAITNWREVIYVSEMHGNFIP